MRETEVKTRVPDTGALRVALRGAGVTLGEPVEQKDTIYVPRPSRLRDVDASISPVLRIRVERDRCLLTSKKDVTDQLDSAEHEVAIDNAEEGASILEDLGYHAVLVVRKSRCRGSFGGMRICLDRVDGLGSFVELQSTAGSVSDPDVARGEMWQLLNSVGVGREDEVVLGYDRLLDEQAPSSARAELPPS